MNKDANIYIAGHRGMVGSAIHRNLVKKGFQNFIFRTSAELDLRNQLQVQAFFEKEKPDYVFLAAAKVGGIQANNIYRADFLYENLMIQNNVIHSAYLSGVKKLMFLGSSCTQIDSFALWYFFVSRVILRAGNGCICSNRITATSVAFNSFLRAIKS